MEEAKIAGREDEAVETLAAAAAAALFVSGVKRFLPAVLGQLSTAAVAVATPPLLLLLLHVVIASIVLISLHPRSTPANLQSIRRSRQRRQIDGNNRRKQQQQQQQLLKKKNKREEEMIKNEEEAVDEGDAEELNARVEAFIVEFRRQLKLDSFSSRVSH
ncbi:hypothetical protein AXF42_Ash006866 [Apostasia shenzhenica]|uniref:DUF4408 domain-containing protein n=1 Tax=Apostasia shenzhenica TaxID=1088818 RepID=A0A2I0AJC0_9ASPA|nr:hypothetical protein AXF42_Ash006866 [Apostasia shenzhenica]